MTRILAMHSHGPSGFGGMRSLLRGVAFNLIGAVTTVAATIGLAVILARILGLNGYGKYSAVQLVVLTVSTLLSQTVSISLSKHVAAFRTTDLERCGSLISLTLYASVAAGVLVSLVLCVWLVQIWREPEIQQGLLPIVIGGCMYIVASVVVAVQLSVLNGFERYSSIARLTVLRNVLIVSLAAIASPIFGAAGAFLGQTFACGIALVLTWSAVKRTGVNIKAFNLSNAMRDMPLLFHTAAPALLGGLATQGATMFAVLRLGACYDSVKELAVFNSANQLRLAVLFLPGLMLNPMIASVTSRIATREYMVVRKMVWASMLLAVGVTAIAALAAAEWGAEIMGLFGRSFRGGGGALLWLAISAIPAAACSVIGVTLACLSRMWANLQLNLFWAGALCACLVLNSANGAHALAFNYALSYGLLLAISGAYLAVYMRRMEKRA